MLYPIGVQSFPEIINDGFVYIDKTELIYQLVQTGRTYFLSRPRRFGKSLLVSTLESLFRGEKKLFEGLWISKSDYDWKSYPVISLDFSMLMTDSYDSLTRTLQNQLQEVANRYNIGEIRKETPPETLVALVQRLSAIDRVVILIDEYDKPILDRLSQTELLDSFRDLFKAFYGHIKGLGKYLRFTMLTGVTKFTQVSLFSGLNNLDDISFSPDYSALLGITESELSTYFLTEITGIAKKQNETVEETLKRIKRWYNGYHFSGIDSASSVYNPLSLMSYFKSHRLANYWFATGTPTFAFQLIKEQNYELPDFESDIVIGNTIEMNHEPSSLDLMTLLYQTGYLTIQSYDERTQRYTLQFPNEEVRKSFFEHLFHYFSQLKEFQISKLLTSIEKSLLEIDLKSFFDFINVLFSSIPYTIQVANEAYYHSLIYLMVKLLGFNVNAEVITNTGRVDLIVEQPGTVLVFEFKFNRSSKEALEQIKKRNYHSKYLASTDKVYLIGANFDASSRSINEWDCENV